ADRQEAGENEKWPHTNQARKCAAGRAGPPLSSTRPEENRVQKAAVLLRFSLLRAEDAGLDLLLCLTGLVGSLPEGRGFPFRLRLAPRATVGDGQMVMSRRVIGLEFRGVFERRDCFGKFPVGDERPAEADESVGECGVEFCRVREMRDGLCPVTRLAREFTEHVLRPGVARVDLQLVF